MKRTLVLLSPLLVGVVATLVSGLVNYPLLVFDREPTRYFTFYGFPAQWYMVPTSQCEALIQQTQAYASCQGGFILSGFLLNLAFYTLLSIPFVHVLTRFSEGAMLHRSFSIFNRTTNQFFKSEKGALLPPTSLNL